MLGRWPAQQAPDQGQSERDQQAKAVHQQGGGGQQAGVFARHTRDRPHGGLVGAQARGPLHRNEGGQLATQGAAQGASPGQFERGRRQGVQQSRHHRDFQAPVAQAPPPAAARGAAVHPGPQAVDQGVAAGQQPAPKALRHEKHRRQAQHAQHAPPQRQARPEQTGQRAEHHRVLDAQPHQAAQRFMPVAAKHALDQPGVAQLTRAHGQQQHRRVVQQHQAQGHRPAHGTLPAPLLAHAGGAAHKAARPQQRSQGPAPPRHGLGHAVHVGPMHLPQQEREQRRAKQPAQGHLEHAATALGRGGRGLSHACAPSAAAFAAHTPGPATPRWR